MNYLQLQQDLKAGKIAPVYLFFGKERFLLQQSLELVKERLLPPGVEDFNLDLINCAEEGLLNLLDAADTLPMLAEMRLVIARECKLFSAAGKETAENDADMEDTQLLRYLENPNPRSCLIFLAGEKVSRRKKITRAIEQLGGMVEFETLKGVALNNWIKDRFAHEGKRIETSGLELLITTVEHDLQLLDSEIDKICTFLGDQKMVTRESVAQLVGRSVQVGIFQVVDALAEKKVLPVIELLRGMLLQGEPPLKIVFMIARPIRLKLEVKTLAAAGIPGEKLSEKMEVHAFVAKKALQQSKNFSLQELITALDKLLQLDLALKSSSGDLLMLMELTVMELCERQ